MERSLPNTEVPGIKSAHAMITDACRRNKRWSLSEALGVLSKAYIDIIAARKENDCANQTTYHLTLSVEDLRHTPNQDVAVRTYIGGVRRKTDELTKEEARNVRIAARHLAGYLTKEYDLGQVGKSTFTAVHFEAIAKVIAQSQGYWHKETDSIEAVDIVRADLSAMFADDNPKFNPERFVEACENG